MTEERAPHPASRCEPDPDPSIGAVFHADDHLRYLLTAFLFENISVAGREEVEAHLRVCESCRIELQQQRELLGEMGSALKQNAELYVFEERRRQRVLEAAKQERFRVLPRLDFKPPWPPRWRFTALAGMLAVLVTGGWWAVSSMGRIYSFKVASGRGLPEIRIYDDIDMAKSASEELTAEDGTAPVEVFDGAEKRIGVFSGYTSSGKTKPEKEKSLRRDLFKNPVSLKTALSPVVNPVVTHEEVEVADSDGTDADRKSAVSSAGPMPSKLDNPILTPGSSSGGGGGAFGFDVERNTGGNEQGPDRGIRRTLNKAEANSEEIPDYQPAYEPASKEAMQYFKNEDKHRLPGTNPERDSRANGKPAEADPVHPLAPKMPPPPPVGSSRPQPEAQFYIEDSQFKRALSKRDEDRRQQQIPAKGAAEGEKHLTRKGQESGVQKPTAPNEDLDEHFEKGQESRIKGPEEPGGRLAGDSSISDAPLGGTGTVAAFGMAIEKDDKIQDAQNGAYENLKGGKKGDESLLVNEKKLTLPITNPGDVLSYAKRFPKDEVKKQFSIGEERFKEARKPAAANEDPDKDLKVGHESSIKAQARSRDDLEINDAPSLGELGPLSINLFGGEEKSVKIQDAKNDADRNREKLKPPKEPLSREEIRPTLEKKVVSEIETATPSGPEDSGRLADRTDTMESTKETSTVQETEMARADKALKDREYPAALARYETIAKNKDLEGTPEWKAANLRIAEVERLTGQYDQATKRLEELSKQNDGQLQVESHYQQAMVVDSDASTICQSDRVAVRVATSSGDATTAFESEPAWYARPDRQWAHAFSEDQLQPIRVAGAQENFLRSVLHYQQNNTAIDLAAFAKSPLPVPPPLLTDEGLPEDEFLERHNTRPFVDAARDNLSTFALDVDTSSYTRARSQLRSGQLPDPETVRVEEFVNYFKQDYEVGGDQAFGVFAECGPAPFAGVGEVELLKIGIKSRDPKPEERKPAMLTIAVDTSGSMGHGRRLNLVQSALRGLVMQLKPEDAICIVAFGAEAELVLPHTFATQKQRILDAITTLSARGGTNVEVGLNYAYLMADEVYSPEAVNRVLLCSDGVANVGAKGPEQMLKRVRGFAARGIDLISIGFGMGNYNDKMMEQLANNGNGSSYFVDSATEAARIFEKQLPPHLEVLARDAKVQVEFNKQVVECYRLLGYENRKIADKDFRNDAVDAGEVGHSRLVTALYEIKRRPMSNGPIGKVFLRWKDAGYRHLPVIERNYPLDEGIVHARLSSTSPEFRFLACVAEFAELLRESRWSRDGAYFMVLQQLLSLPPQFTQNNQEWKEVVELVANAQALSIEKWLKRAGE